MRKIHLIPTEKPSRLVIDTIENKLYLQPILHEKTLNVIPQHIYITSDEEIKEGYWFLRKGKIHKLRYNDGNGNLWTKNGLKIYASGSKKIILTTDQDLIKDGVQAIPDEFLEWFVKNPSCEFVEVEKDEFYFKKAFIEGKDAITYEYKIIIPQEEPNYMVKGGSDAVFPSSNIITFNTKQETTLEEAACLVLGYAYDLWVSMHSKDQSSLIYIEVTNWCKGAKWQAERMYSEEEVIAIVQKSRETGLTVIEYLILTERFKKK